ncbi:glycosyltransferase [Bradyrhizobium sp. 160]|uniref:glycosyltransferase n=1 Tax=unclassified Bradyrhizobium TaxID=2631580 RepID=UPI001FF9AE66|nr:MULTISPECIES: glycosyltransferase [unclassified Bradyrhizobium]MCK1542459.1 glycosyltransferase [Bradyrhizobium sp. 179]MCK1623108.1 glycosyltransferase [Bradyrhizobium sp. 160]
MSDDVVGLAKTVLVLAYHFPPIGGAGVQRTVKFVKYLPEFGFRPVVVTTGDASTAPSSPRDPSLHREIPAGTPVYRTQNTPAAPFGHRIASIEDRLLGLVGRSGRNSRAWIEACTNVGLQAGLENPPDLVYASLSPFESCPAAAFIAQAFGVPWVADLRDPWALDEMMVYSSRWHRAAEIRRMRRELSTARLIIMNTPEATRALKQAMPEFSKRAVTITNGFDADDFARPPSPKLQGQFRIVHTGHLHSELGARHRRNRLVRRLLGGHRLPVDVETRSHIYLLAALARWRSETPDMSRHVRLVLAGPMTPSDRLIVERSGVSDLVEMPGYVDHQRSIDFIRSAEILFLPMHNLPVEEKARLVPGKTYEYLAAGPPILAAVPDGDASDLVKQSRNGDVCRPDDVDGMLASLRARYESWLVGKQQLPTNPDFCSRFERRELTRALAANFECILPR